MALPEVEYDWEAVCEIEQYDEASSGCNKLMYAVFAEMIESSILGEYCSYGISVTDEWGCCLGKVHDVTCEREQLTVLVDLCNRLNLSFCHLNDVIEDFLC